MNDSTTFQVDACCHRFPCPLHTVCPHQMQVAVAPHAAAGPYPTAMRPATAEEAAAIGRRIKGNTNPLTRDDLRRDINVMEALDSVLGAIDEVSGVELEPGDRPELNITFFTAKNSAAAAIHAIPNAVALAGLRAMQRMLEQMLLREPLETTTDQQ